MADHTVDWHVRIVDEVGKWESLRPDWDRLAGSRIFCRFDWMRGWWRSYGFDRGRPFIVVVSDENGVVRGLAPWWRQVSVTSGRLLQFLGSGDVCSDYLSLLSLPKDEQAVARTVADWLCRGQGWDALELDGVLQEDSAISVMLSACRDRGCSLAERPAMSCWHLQLPTSWEEYVGRLSKSHRKQVRRVERRLLQTGQFQLRRAQTEQERNRVFAELVRLHQLRWESVGEPGVFSTQRFSDFLREITETWFASGKVHLYELVENGRTLAAEIHFVQDGISYAYQAGVDPAERARDVGHAMNVAVIRYLIEEGMRGLDFLRGDEPYKAHFRAVPRPAAWYRLGAPQIRGKVRHQAWAAQRAVRSWVKAAWGMAGREQG